MKKLSVKTFGSYSKRRDYGKIKFTHDLPNLIENQLKSYKHFLDNGIDEVFQEFFPITSNNEKFSGDYSFKV